MSRLLTMVQVLVVPDTTLLLLLLLPALPHSVTDAASL